MGRGLLYWPLPLPPAQTHQQATIWRTSLSRPVDPLLCLLVCMTVTMETAHLWILKLDWCKCVSGHMNLLLCFHGRCRAHWVHSAPQKQLTPPHTPPPHTKRPLFLLHTLAEIARLIYSGISSLHLFLSISQMKSLPQQQIWSTLISLRTLSDLPPLRQLDPQFRACGSTYVCPWNSRGSRSSISAALTIRTLEAQVQPVLKRWFSSKISVVKGGIEIHSLVLRLQWNLLLCHPKHP